ncbi:MAG: Gx transporter family protein [Clostridia bacterium]|nr:Gx transporter family protein [Clostridia bacterium]
MRMDTKKLTTLSITVTIAMALSFLESQIPAFVAVPGVKVGLANIAIFFILYRFGIKEAALVSGVRVVLMGLLFGNFVSMLYSIAGAVLSLSVMVLFKKLAFFGEVGVSVLGGITHNIAQICMACLLLRSDAILYYLPVLLLSGTVAGIVVGIVAAILIRKVKI